MKALSPEDLIVATDLLKEHGMDDAAELLARANGMRESVERMQQRLDRPIFRLCSRCWGTGSHADPTMPLMAEAPYITCLVCDGSGTRSS